jgi:signal transduction histidine kinase
VNVSTSLVQDRLKKSRVANFTKTVALLHEHQSDLGTFLSEDSKGKQVLSYLEQLSGHLASEREVALSELAELSRHIEHIKDIVIVQQSYARVSGVFQRVQICQLIEDALRMNTVALARHGVRVIRQFEKNLPEMDLDKHKVLQILINLISNAKYACDASSRQDKQLIFGVRRRQQTVLVSVQDNGIGIPEENLTRIFQHGFTTRKKGHGFGLHSGALAAKEMGGTLRAHSEGAGKGATFTLELTISPPSRSS